jgi:hypothetical protein
MQGDRRPGTSSRAKFVAAIRERMCLDEDWQDFLPIEEPPSFLRKVESLDLFARGFELMLNQGCRWDILLLCLELFANYNNSFESVVSRNDEGEVITRIARLTPKLDPPNSEHRATNSANLDAAIKILKEYESLLVERAILTPPPHAGWVQEPPDQLAVITSVEYLQRLLRWARDVLTEPGENFRTVKNAGRVLPCLYVEEAASSGEHIIELFCLFVIYECEVSHLEHANVTGSCHHSSPNGNSRGLSVC